MREPEASRGRVTPRERESTAVRMRARGDAESASVAAVAGAGSVAALRLTSSILMLGAERDRQYSLGRVTPREYGRRGACHVPGELLHGSHHHAWWHGARRDLLSTTWRNEMLWSWHRVSSLALTCWGQAGRLPRARRASSRLPSPCMVAWCGGNLEQQLERDCQLVSTSTSLPACQPSSCAMI